MKRLVLVVMLVARSAYPCAPAPPQGQEVAIADEEAVIVWDPASQTETFIRRAAFVSTAASFGFLVPTPTLPAVTEDPLDLEPLRRAIAPREVSETRGIEIDTSPLALVCMGGSMKSGPMAAGEDVRVLQTAHVAGFDATTLAADDPAALSAWLDRHGYATTPELTAWLANYTSAKWVITAFVVEKEPRNDTVATRNVRMTFKTERPFYPYREPASAKSAPHRLLRVWMFSPERVAGTIGTAPWPARTLWSGMYDPRPEEAALVGANKHLTVFDDTSSPRRGTDEVYFAKSPTQTDVEQPPIVHVHPHSIMFPLDLVALVTVIVVIVVVRRRKRVR